MSIFRCLFILVFLCAQASFSEAVRMMNFVTVSDTEHFPWVKGLIESIMRHNAATVACIAVFDLGLTSSEIEILNKLPYVKVFPIPDVNSAMRKKFMVRSSGRQARGWYSWKPAVIYTALTIFPSILYLDAGLEVIAPLDDVFGEIEKAGYYLCETSHAFGPVATEHLKRLFHLDRDENRWILDCHCLSSNIQGLSRAMVKSYVIPLYELAFDIRNFEDDGTAPWGFGFARHDQSLSHILARKLHLTLHPLWCEPRRERVNGRNVLYWGAAKYFELRKHTERDPERIKHAQDHKVWDQSKVCRE